jgi:hypothetical protein
VYDAAILPLNYRGITGSGVLIATSQDNHADLRSRHSRVVYLLAPGQRLELQLTAPEAVVLPLDDPGMRHIRNRAYARPRVFALEDSRSVGGEGVGPSHGCF